MPPRRQLSGRSGQAIQVWVWGSHSAGMRKPSSRGMLLRVFIDPPLVCSGSAARRNNCVENGFGLAHLQPVNSAPSAILALFFSSSRDPEQFMKGGRGQPAGEQCIANGLAPVFMPQDSREPSRVLIGEYRFGRRSRNTPQALRTCSSLSRSKLCTRMPSSVWPSSSTLAPNWSAMKEEP
ncbi:hypothetical protein D3C84_903400 [compost metagenome]